MSNELRTRLRELHRELWQWLADNPDKGKTDWPGWKRRSEDPEIDEAYRHASCCFSCLCAGFEKILRTCRKCPCDWGARRCGPGHYGRWLCSPDPAARRRYALRVRDAWPEEKRK
jgi:hypothetical protein